jgi:hypothetical protein
MIQLLTSLLEILLAFRQVLTSLIEILLAFRPQTQLQTVLVYQTKALMTDTQYMWIEIQMNQWRYKTISQIQPIEIEIATLLLNQRLWIVIVLTSATGLTFQICRETEIIQQIHRDSVKLKRTDIWQILKRKVKHMWINPYSDHKINPVCRMC